MNLVHNKQYIKYSVSTDSSIFGGYVNGYAASEDLLKRLSKDLGFSYELYCNISSIDSEAASRIVTAMSSKTYPEITLLLDMENKVVLDYVLDGERCPILNAEFMKRVISLIETSDEVSISERYYLPEESTSSVVIKKSKPIIVEEKFSNKPSNYIEYYIGVLLVNEERSGAYTRLVLYVNGQPLYLPSSYYSTTTSRYRRSTSSTVEALEVLVLKIIDDLREDTLQSKIQDFHYRYRANKKILASYEEYNAVLRTMRRIPTIIEDNSYLENLLSKYENFERKYTLLEDKKSSYVWRCTAMSDISVGDLVSITVRILDELGAPMGEYFQIRELLGSYISTSRIAEEIAE